MTEYYTREAGQKILADLGEEEVTKRAAELGSYERYASAGAVFDPDNGGEIPMTPDTTIALAKLAVALSTQLDRKVFVQGSKLVVEKSPERLAEAVASQEFYRRQRAAKEAAEAAEGSDA